MNLIINNPYRTLGLLVGSSAAQQNRQLSRLKMYIEAEQEPEQDFSFPSLGINKRSIEIIEYAASKLNLDADKMLYSLFWFYNGNPITDEPAFDALKEEGTEETKEIWRNLAINDEDESFNPITKRNASAYHNLSTLYLEEFGIDEETIKLKLLFIESDYFKDLVDKATDVTYKISQKDAQLMFLNALVEFDDIDESELLDAIENINFIAKNEFLKNAVDTPISKIESEIQQSRSKRQANKANAFSIGKNIHSSTKSNLQLVATILGSTNIKYSSIADKVADEILQCGIDYFKHYRDSTKDPSNDSMRLFTIAKGIARGAVVKQRINENTENLQDWIDGKEEREKGAQIVSDLEVIKKLIDEFELKPETIANARILLSRAKPHLSSIKTVLGVSDELYLNICTRIASDAQGMCVSEINKLQDRISSAYDYTSKNILLRTLKDKVQEAWAITESIGQMDLNPTFRTQWQSNKSSLASLRNTLSSISTGSSTSSESSSGSSSGSSGCYIATMAYEDYDHPQVLILRNFRDEKLVNTRLGRLFIKSYYSFSPYLVRKLKNYNGVNKIIRSGLDFIINKYLIKK
jgi:hypothetical protein